MIMCLCCGEYREPRWFPLPPAHPLHDFCGTCLDDLDAMGVFDNG